MSTGFVSCYLDLKGSLLLVPYARLPNGQDRVVNRPTLLSIAVTNEELGQAVRETLRWCNPTLYDANAPLPQLTATSTRTWSQFAKDRVMVGVSFRQDCIRVTPTKRDKKGAFLFKESDELPTGTLNHALGVAIRNAFAACS